MATAKKIVKYCIYIFLLIVLITVVAFFVVTSSSFLTGVVLPMVSDEAGIRIAAKDVSVSVFGGSIKASGVEVGSAKKPLVKNGDLKGEFALSKLISGVISLKNVQLKNATILLAKDANDRWNWEDEAQAAKTEEPARTEEKEKTTEKSKAPSESDKLIFDLQNISVVDSSFLLEVADTKMSDAISKVELSDLNIQAAVFKNNEKSRITIKSGLSVLSGNDIQVKNGKLDISLDCMFDDYMTPQAINLMSNLSDARGQVTGIRVENSNLALLLNAVGDDKGLNIKNLLLRQVRSGKLLTSVSVQSQLKYDPFSIKGKIKVNPLSEEIVSVVSNFAGHINPGLVKLKYSGDFDISDTVIGSKGSFTISRAGAAYIDGKKYPLPPIYMGGDYDFSLDMKKSSLRVTKLSAHMLENQKQVFSMDVKKPFECVYKECPKFPGAPPELDMKITDFDLRLAKLFLPSDSGFVVHQGTLNAAFKCLFESDINGLKISGDVKTRGTDFSINGDRIKNIGTDQSFAVKVSDMKNVTGNFMMTLSRAENHILTFCGMVSGSMPEQKGTFSVSLKRLTNRSIRYLPVPDKIRQEISANVAKLERFSLVLISDGSVDFKANKLDLKKCVLEFWQRRKVMTLKVMPLVMPLDEAPEKCQLVMNITRMPVGQLSNFLPEKTIRFKGGNIIGKMVADISKQGKEINTRFNAAIQGADVQKHGKVISNVTADIVSIASFKDFDKLQLNKFDIRMASGGKDAAHIQLTGDTDFTKGAGNIALRVHFLNYNFLNLFRPGEFKNGLITGNIKTSIDDKFKNYEIKGALAAHHILMAHLGKEVHSKARFDLKLKPEMLRCKDFYLDVSKGMTKAVVLRGSTVVPDQKLNKPVVIKLNSDVIDIELLKKIFGKREPHYTGKNEYKKYQSKMFRPEEEKKPLHFDFGREKYLALIDLKNIKYNSKLTCDIKSKIEAEGREILADPIDIYVNKSLVQSALKLVSTPEGLTYRLKAISNKVTLDAIFEALLIGNMRNTKGTIDKLNVDIHGSGIRPPELWDHMQGYAKVNMSKVEIPNDFGKTLIGRVVLLPFEVLGKIQSMMPGEKQPEKLDEVVDFVTDYQRSSRIIKFDQGQVDLKSEYGRIFINKFNFTGNFVRQLMFSGSLGLGSNTELDMASRLNVNQIILPVRLRGTIYQPRTSYTATLTRFISDNALNILGITGNVLNEGGKGLRNVLEGAVNVIQNSSSGSSSQSGPAKSSSGSSSESGSDSGSGNTTEPVRNLLRNIFE
ncbi:MAG: AsmA family protein [Lentisphaerae bacterium]|nr:AsmA family protein [Lentisphaerota bacterium]MCP4103675.1 AsmA family protein [Lentisphaerota bacterium]